MAFIIVSWLLQIGDVLRVTNYPHSMNSREEAEEAASQKALQQLPQLAKKRKAAQQNTTADYNVSIPRVKKVRTVGALNLTTRIPFSILSLH